MIPDLDIFRAASILVKQHGDDASVVDAKGVGPALDERPGFTKPAPSSLRRANLWVSEKIHCIVVRTVATG